MSSELARRDDLVVKPWTRGVMLLREGDGLNEPQALVLSAEELHWLVLIGGPAAMHEIEGAIPKVETRATRSCPQ